MQMMNNLIRPFFKIALFGLFLPSSVIAVSANAFATSKVNDFRIVPFTAVYDMYRQGDRLGDGERALTKNDDSTYTLSLKSELKWLIFSDKRKEQSSFKVKDGKVTPVHFTYKRTGTGKDDDVFIEFRENKDLVIVPKAKRDPAPNKWQDGWQDEMSLHAQIQFDLMAGKKLFNYTIVADNGRLREYEFEVIGEELISTGFGRFKAIKVARIYDDKKFYAQHAWFIPELNFTLARLWRMKKGVEQYDLVINSYNVTE